MKKQIYLITCFILACCFSISCEKFPIPINTTDSDALSKPGQKQLNVIYFLPNDAVPYENYQERITGYLKHAQKYYAEQLQDNGFNYKKFGLEEDENVSGQVKIHLINAAGPKTDYPYSGGGNKAVNEIKAYFAANPELQTSEHFLVFIPRYDIGVPFYGLGKFAFVRDYENGYDMTKWEDGVGMPTIDDKWVGGSMHELGHGLNLPHNRQKVSDNFIAMMGNGNSSYWNNPNGVKFTKASALILDNNEIFNTDGVDYYNEQPTITISKERIYADNENLYVNVTFESTLEVGGVIAYNDPKTGPNDQAYNAISWTTTNITEHNGKKEFMFTMPLSDIDENFKQYPFELRLSYVFKNGVKKVVSKYNYSFVDGTPDIDVNYIVYEDLDRSLWSIESVSSEDAVFQGGALAVNVLDGDVNTIWHTGYSTTYPHPHDITINMGQLENILGISITQNQSNNNGMIKDFTLLVSTDNVTYTEIGDFRASTSMSRQQFVFDEAVDAQYFKIISHNSHNNRPVTRFAEVTAF